MAIIERMAAHQGWPLSRVPLYESNKRQTINLLTAHKNYNVMATATCI